ncbi:hypothetical protein [uncultured Pontibacter sp.]|uniref:hypothetical protein n=1 Tax=uncultured Pontibacter sp. TaxID=453356 RepID=UPI00262251CA|nr:hypothetical protein [uncultured Pontibacter sp.]
MTETRKTQKEIAQEWLHYALQGWETEVKRLKAVNSGSLLSSFKGTVIAGAENALQVTVAYAWYGQMVDAGLGRGYKYGEQADTASERKLLGGKGRRPKPFWSKGKAGIGNQTYRLKDLLAANIGDETVNKILDDIALNHTIKIS